MKAIAVSRRGESHRADGRECQDFSLAEARGSFAMAVVCDGHGGRRYFRSRAGAEAAAEVTRSCVSELIENADPGLFTSKPVTGREALTTERGKKDLRKWDERDELMHRLFGAIAVRWRDRIAGHAREHPLTEEERQALRQIARQSIVSAFDDTKMDHSVVAEQHPVLKQKCGAFVTLTQQGRLRGCIGLLRGSLPLHETVFKMARAAAFEDPRFPELRRDELDKTDIEISVITPMRRIHSLDEFELHRHGIYIKKGSRSGTFLPQVADDVNWTKEEFVGHCSRDKAGLGWDGWRDAELYVYEAIVF